MINTRLDHSRKGFPVLNPEFYDDLYNFNPVFETKHKNGANTSQ
jgi:hypothetical protein